MSKTIFINFAKSIDIKHRFCDTNPVSTITSIHREGIIMAKKKILRSTAELNARYVRFCENHDLNSSIPADEQIAENEKQQQWLDNLVESLEMAAAVERGTAELKSNVELEDNKSGAQKAATILCAIGKKDAALSAVLRKGETLLSALTIVTPLTLCRATSYETVESRANKRGEIQMGWAM